MSQQSPSTTLGVEEEFFVIDAETRELRPRAQRVLDRAREVLDGHVELEINLAQIETATPVCATLEDLDRQLRRLRLGLHRAAVEQGSQVAPIGTHPFSKWLGQQIAPKDRYRQLEVDGQRIAWEQLTCGCHVHVGVDDPDLAVRVMDAVRPWLPILRAMTASSPYWEGVDTGYASYRMMVFDRWPTAGIPPLLGSRAAYVALVDDLLATEVIPGEPRIYWDVRPSSRFDTLEFRVADVLPTVDEAVLLAALCRALVQTALPWAADGRPLLDLPDPVLVGARWRAARFGLEGTLVDVEQRTTRPAAEAVAGLLALVRPTLEATGDFGRVEEGVARLLREGTGAARQRRAAAQGDLVGVVDGMVEASVAAAHRTAPD